MYAYVPYMYSIWYGICSNMQIHVNYVQIYVQIYETYMWIMCFLMQ